MTIPCSISSFRARSETLRWRRTHSSSRCRRARNWWRKRTDVAEWVLKYADPRGEIHQQVAQAATEKEVRDRYSQQGFLVYWVKPRRALTGVQAQVSSGVFGRRKKLNLEKFLIFNQQFVTLI